MWNNIGLDQCLAFVKCQTSPGLWNPEESAIKPTITISRQTGAGGRTVAGKLVEYLQAQFPARAPWTIFDRQLLEQVLDDHHLSKTIAEYMPENHKPILADLLEELFGNHPSTWTLVHQTAETMLRLAKMGNVILIGRGANVVTSKLKDAFHVRLVGSVEKRVEQVQQIYHLDRRAALERLHREDKGRRQYLKEHFHQEIDDPLLYHLVINTDRISHEDAARLIGAEVVHRFQLARRGVAAET